MAVTDKGPFTILREYSSAYTHASQPLHGYPQPASPLPFHYAAPVPSPWSYPGSDGPVPSPWSYPGSDGPVPSPWSYPGSAGHYPRRAPASVPPHGPFPPMMPFGTPQAPPPPPPPHGQGPDLASLYPPGYSSYSAPPGTAAPGPSHLPPGASLGAGARARVPSAIAHAKSQRVRSRTQWDCSRLSRVVSTFDATESPQRASRLKTVKRPECPKCAKCLRCVRT